MKRKISKVFSLFLTAALLLTILSITSFNAASDGIVYGDADKSGDVSVMDATLIQKYLADLITEDEIDLTAAEVTGDSNISVLDATCIQESHLISAL